MAYSPDGSVIAIGSGKQVLLVDAGVGLEIQRLGGHTQDVSAVAFSPDGFLLATAGAGYNLDEGELQLWTLTSGEARRLSAPIENRSVLSLAVSPTGRILATGDQRGRLDLLSTEAAGTDISFTETESRRKTRRPCGHIRIGFARLPSIRRTEELFRSTTTV